MQNVKEAVVMFGVTLLVLFGMGVLFAGVEMWLWNQVMPDVFGVRAITFWQALCLSWLSMMLFKSVMPSSSKSEETLAGIRLLHQAQLSLLEQIRELHGIEVNSLDDVKGSLQDVTNALERQR
jgi:hypothetical protein